MATAISSSTPKVSPRPPVYQGHFLLGALPDYRRDTLGFFQQASQEYGDLFEIRFGPARFFVLNHPDYVQYILQKNYRNYRRNPYGNNLLKVVSGLNLFTSDGDSWLSQRRLMQPAFHRRRIAGFGSTITEATLKMLAGWSAQPDTWLDVQKAMTRLTLEIVGQALFSVDLSADTSTMGQIFNTIFDFLNHRFSTFIDFPLFVPTRRNLALKRNLRHGGAMLHDMIDERRHSDIVKDDLMSMLMEARDAETGQGMTDDQICNELRVMLAAGHETTSNALSWIFYLISQHPQVEARVLAELDSVLAGRLPTVDDVPALTYTRQVVQESMRLYPPAWTLFGRQAIEADEIDGYTIPAGMGIFALPYLLHRDPRFWPEPERFDPDRFTPDQEAERHKMSYLPFSSGPRKCIGDSFAMTEIQLVLAIVLPRCQLRLKPGYQIEPEPIFTLRIKNGLPMSLTQRA